MSDDGTTIDPDIVQTAIAWLLRVQNDGASWSACEAWQREHADHARAWQRVVKLDAELDARLRGQAAHGVRLTQALDRATTRLRRRRHALKLFSFVLAGFCISWFAGNFAQQRGWFADHVTATGERLRVTLQDGSVLALNTRSAADTRFDGLQRLILLRRGEILVDSGADAGFASHRPLRVRTRDGLFEAVGTRFTVRLLDESTLLSVQEGQVRVRPGGAVGFQSSVNPGESVRVTRDGIHVADPHGLSSGAWDDGVLDVRDMPLDEFLVEVSRYRHGRLTHDPAVAALRVSGVFQLEDTDRLLTLLPRTLPVVMQQRADGGIHVAMATPPASDRVSR